MQWLFNSMCRSKPTHGALASPFGRMSYCSQPIKTIFQNSEDSLAVWWQYTASIMCPHSILHSDSKQVFMCWNLQLEFELKLGNFAIDDSMTPCPCQIRLSILLMNCKLSLVWWFQNSKWEHCFIPVWTPYPIPRSLLWEYNPPVCPSLLPVEPSCWHQTHVTLLRHLTQT